MLRKNKRKVFLLFFLLALVLGSSVIYANYFADVKTDLATFIKSDEDIVILKRDNDRYFVKKEHFDKKGNYKKPAVEKEINRLEYNMLKEAKDYDLIETYATEDLIDENILTYQVVDREGNVLSGSYVANIDKEDKFKLDFDTAGRKKILYSDSDRYFIKNLTVDKTGDYVEDAVILEVSKKDFEKEKGEGKFNYLKEVENTLDDKKEVVTSISYLDSNLEEITKPLVAKHKEEVSLRSYMLANEPLLAKNMKKWNPKLVAEVEEESKVVNKNEKKNPNEDDQGFIPYEEEIDESGLYNPSDIGDMLNPDLGQQDWGTNPEDQLDKEDDYNDHFDSDAADSWDDFLTDDDDNDNDTGS